MTEAVEATAAADTSGSTPEATVKPSSGNRMMAVDAPNDVSHPSLDGFLSLHEKVRTAFSRLESKEAILSDCLISWRELDAYLRAKEADVARRQADVERGEKELQEKVRDKTKELEDREKAVEKRERTSLDRIQSHRDAAFAAIEKERQKLTEQSGKENRKNDKQRDDRSSRERERDTDREIERKRKSSSSADRDAHKETMTKEDAKKAIDKKGSQSGGKDGKGVHPDTASDVVKTSANLTDSKTQPGNTAIDSAVEAKRVAKNGGQASDANVVVALAAAKTGEKGGEKELVVQAASSEGMPDETPAGKQETASVSAETTDMADHIAADGGNNREGEGGGLTAASLGENEVRGSTEAVTGEEERAHDGGHGVPATPAVADVAMAEEADHPVDIKQPACGADDDAGVKGEDNIAGGGNEGSNDESGRGCADIVASADVMATKNDPAGDVDAGVAREKGKENSEERSGSAGADTAAGDAASAAPGSALAAKEEEREQDGGGMDMGAPATAAAAANAPAAAAPADDHAAAANACAASSVDGNVEIAAGADANANEDGCYDDGGGMAAEPVAADEGGLVTVEAAADVADGMDAGLAEDVDADVADEVDGGYDDYDDEDEHELDIHGEDFEDAMEVMEEERGEREEGKDGVKEEYEQEGDKCERGGDSRDGKKEKDVREDEEGGGKKGEDEKMERKDEVSKKEASSKAKPMDSKGEGSSKGHSKEGEAGRHPTLKPRDKDAPPSKEQEKILEDLTRVCELMDSDALTRCVVRLLQAGREARGKADSLSGEGFVREKLPGVLSCAVDAPRLVLGCLEGYEPRVRESGGRESEGRDWRREVADPVRLKACSILVEALAAMLLKQAEEEGAEKVPAMAESVRSQAKGVMDR